MAGFGFPTALNNAGLPGDPIFFEASVNSITGSPKTVFSVNILNGTTLNLVSVHLSAQFSGILRVKNNSGLLISRRVRPGKPDIDFYWPIVRSLPGPDVVTIEFEQRSNSPIVQIDGLLTATVQ